MANCYRGDRHGYVRPVFCAANQYGVADCPGNVHNAFQQSFVLFLSRISGRTFPYPNSGSRNRVCLFLEPPFNHIHKLHDCFLPREVWYEGCLRLHRDEYVDGRALDKPLWPPNQRPRTRGDIALGPPKTLSPFVPILTAYFTNITRYIFNFSALS